MPTPFFVVVSGLPGSGKSTLAVGIADRLSLPLLDKDVVLEALFDSPGWGTAEQRHTLSRAGDAVLLALARDNERAVLVNWWAPRLRARTTGRPRRSPRRGVLRLPGALLDELAAGGAAMCGEWAGVVADIAAQHARRDARLADLDAHPARRFPTAALRRHTQIRDRTCTFPGCRRRAHASHTDHTRDHARGGPTSTTNTAPACGHDHDVKHRGGWKLAQPEPGRFLWRSPLGGQYRTSGEFLLPELPDPHPADPGPDFDQPSHTVDGPILQPHHPVQPPRPPPPRRDLPDDPPF